MDSNLSKGKRKRGSSVDDGRADGDEDPTSLCLQNLPDAALRCVASFLPLNNKVKLAMALPTWECTPTHDVSKAILGAERVEAVDFGDLDNARTLTDADLNRILLSMDAVNNLKVLKLTYCVQIEGRGLESLRGSTVLEKIDLSLLPRYYEKKSSLNGVSLSFRAVMPILNSIIAADRGQLKYIQFHSSWCEFDGSTDDFNQFISRYNNLALRCERCNVDDVDRGFSDATRPARRVIRLIHRRDVPNNTQRIPGIETRTCYECERHLCISCIRSSEGFWNINSCVCCEKSTCNDCCHVRECSVCQRPVCAGCVVNKDCIRCNLCSSCTIDCVGCGVASCGCLFNFCDGCEISSCTDCRIVFNCEECHDILCEDCGGIDGCGNCPNFCAKCLPKCKLSSMDCLECLSKWKSYHEKRANSFDERIGRLTADNQTNV